MACAFGMTGSHAMGMLGHLYPPLVVPLLVIITILVTMVCRFYAGPPPGSLLLDRPYWVPVLAHRDTR